MAPAGDLDPALEVRLEWIRTHGGLRPGWTPHAVIAAFVDVIAPPSAPGLVAALAPGEPLTMRRAVSPPSPRLQFDVATREGRPLGRVGGAAALMIDVALAASVLPQLRVLAADATRSRECCLQLTLELIVWLAPGEPLAPPSAYDEDVR